MELFIKLLTTEGTEFTEKKIRVLCVIRGLNLEIIMNLKLSVNP
jgi:hypothetical protein